MTDEKSLYPAEPSAPQPPETSALRDRRAKPEGVVPRQAQSYMVAGLAVLVLMATGLAAVVKSFEPVRGFDERL